MENINPYLIELGKIGQLELGYITVAENSKLPFDIKRVYWTYYTPDSVTRGNHAHYELEQLIFSVSGTIDFKLENIYGKKFSFRLEQPNMGLYVPKLHWREFKLSHNSVLLCLASAEYVQEDYIRDYEFFKDLKNRK